MKEQLQYIAGIVAIAPVMPFLLWQGRKVRAAVPKLPEAVKNRCASVGAGSSRLKLLAIGESTVAGVGVDDHCRGMVGQLATSLSKTLSCRVCWQILAKSGLNARQVRRQLLPQLPADSVDLILIGLGGNDTFEMTSPYRWRREMHQMILQLRQQQPESSVLLVQMPPVKDFPALTPLLRRVLGHQVDLLGKVLHDLVEEHPKVFFPKEPVRLEEWAGQIPGVNGPKPFFSDGVHPSELTYRIWGQEMADFILRNGLI